MAKGDKLIQREKYTELFEDTVESFMKVFNAKQLPIKDQLEFIGCNTQKEIVKISKIPDQYEFLLKKMLLVSINEDMMHDFDDECIEILFEQEIDRLYYDAEKDKVKINKPDVVTTSGLVRKWGIDKVARANNVSLLYNQQKEDEKEQ